MAKFKMGDRFKVVGNVDEHFDSFVGETGTIEYVDSSDSEFGQFYWVSLDDPDAALGDVYFFESELEKLED